VPRPKPSPWEWPDLKRVNARHLYPDAVLDEIVRHLYPMSSYDERKAKNKIINIVSALNSELLLRNRPTLGKQRAALKPLADNLHKALLALSKLDQLSRARLEEAVGNDKTRGREDDPGSGAQRSVARSACAVRDLHRWANSATPPKETKPVRPKKIGLPAQKTAIKGLEALWIACKGTLPTMKGFTAFVEAALGPVLRVHEQNESLGPLVGHILHGRK
jgi:hypothetical protein